MRLSNPFLLREMWVWRRQAGRLRLSDTRLLFLLALIGPWPMVWAFGGSPVHALVFSLWLWVTGMLLCGLYLPVGVYARERDLGTLDVVSITATRPLDEAVGRWMAALLPLRDCWLMGLAVVLAGPLVGACYPDDMLGMPAVQIVAWGILFWLLAGVMAGGYAAMSLAWSAASAKPQGASTSTLGTVLGLTVLYGCVSVNAHPPLSLYTCALPPSPLGFVLVVKGSLLPFYLLLPAWALFTWISLVALEGQLRRGRHLRVAAATPPESRGLVPASPVGIRCLSRPHAAVAGNRVAPKRSGVAEALLSFAHGNPFYEAWRGGFVRLFPIGAAPGNALPPGILIAFLLLYPVIATFSLDVSGALYGPGCWLTVAVAIAVIFGLSQGHHLGARALSAERDQDTWPLLVVTGMKPHRILVGKFAASFYALSGEWVVTLPFWLLAAALTGNFALPLLAVIQPASIAIGIISGLWLASQPRYLVIHVAKAGAAVAATCIALATFHDMALKALLAMVFEPTAAAFNIATRATSPSTLAHYAVGMALTSIACTLIWRSSETRLRKVMQGE